MTSTIQIRVEEKIKRDAQKIFEKMGLDLSSGLKMYLTQVIRTKGIPFQPLTENGMTPAQEARILRETAYAEKHGKRYKTAKEALDDILE